MCKVNVADMATYDAKTELEIAYLKERMNLSRAECIEYLGLGIEDCISYVKPKN